MTEEHDVIIVGAGSAGLAALREVRKRTERFVLINDGPYGTTCARVGCMPSKVLIEAANAYHRRHAFEALGVRGGQALELDGPAVLRRVRTLRDGFVAGVLKATDSLGARNIPGRARLLGPNRVEVNGRELCARRIVLATGSRPVVPDGWRAHGRYLLTTDQLFDLESLPKRMAVVGLGAVGVEMAQGLSRLGVDVVGFGAHSTLAGLDDEIVSDTLRDLLRKEMSLHLGRRADLSEHADGIGVGTDETAATVDRVLVAIGRRPNVDELGLETLGVTLDASGLPPVNPSTLQVADLPVFLAGDANGQRAILHEAADEGHIAGINACSDTVVCFQRRTTLNIVFSDPSVAVVGQRLAELDPKSTVIGRFDFDRQARARAAERNQGTLRLYAGARDGRLLGAELCTPAGEHLAHLLALAIDRRMTVEELLRLPFYHPVLEEGLRSTLRRLADQLPAGSESDLASCPEFQVEALD